MTGTYREQILRVIFRNSEFFLLDVRDVVNGIVKFWWIIIDVKNLNKNCGRVGEFIVEHPIG